VRVRDSPLQFDVYLDYLFFLSHESLCCSPFFLSFSLFFFTTLSLSLSFFFFQPVITHTTSTLLAQDFGGGVFVATDSNLFVSNSNIHNNDAVRIQCAFTQKIYINELLKLSA
jgi:hypothetical protein